MDKRNTPIIDAIIRQHQEDGGIDPYNSGQYRVLNHATHPESAHKEAEEILACFETELTLKP